MNLKSILLCQLVQRHPEIKLDKDVLEEYAVYPCCLANGYLKISIAGQQHFLHRLITTCIGFVVDHVNGNTLDNRRENLRVCTQLQNSANRLLASSNTSGYKGVSKARNKWSAKIMKNYKMYHIGNYATPELAAAAYNRKALELHGEFALLNKLPESETV